MQTIEGEQVQACIRHVLEARVHYPLLIQETLSSDS
jgi:hypothetical protein